MPMPRSKRQLPLSNAGDIIVLSLGVSTALAEWTVELSYYNINYR